MTGPVVAGGARNFILTPGAAPTLLTEYAGGDRAPLSVINTSSVRVYLAADGAVAPSSGVPLDPMTSLPWSTAGQLWAIADPAGSGPAAVTITSAIDSWTPSPVSVAAQVAAQLLASGVPPVYVNQTLADGQNLPAGGTLEFDVSVYSQAAITCNRRIEITQRDQNGNMLDQEIVTPVSPLPQFASPFRVALVGSSLTITSLDATNAATLTVEATNRFPNARLDARENTGDGEHWSLPSTAMSLGQTYALSRDLNFAKMQGQVFARFHLGSGAIGGQFQLTAGNMTVPICDTTEMFHDSANDQSKDKMIAVPAGIYTISFLCRGTAATSLADVWLVAALL